MKSHLVCIFTVICDYSIYLPCQGGGGGGGGSGKASMNEKFGRWFLSSPLVLSRLTTAVVGFFVWQWQQVCDQISNLRLYYVDSGTQHHSKMIF